MWQTKRIKNMDEWKQNNIRGIKRNGLMYVNRRRSRRKCTELL